MEEKEKESLNSSVEEKGEIVTEIILFSGGNKKTFEGIKTDTISQNEFTHFDLIDGRRVYINTKNVDSFEVFTEKPKEKQADVKKQNSSNNSFDSKYNNF